MPECAAILRALVTLLECECRICVHFDSTSAAHSIEGKSACNDIVAKAASGVLMVHRMQERHVAFVHEKSHSGIPQNELVDLLAKHALKGHAYGPNQDTVSTTVLEGILPWLWMAVDGLKKQPQWPHLDPHDGCFHGMLRCKLQEQLQHEPNESEDTDEGLQMTTLRMVTYNALSMRCKANQVAIACMLHRNSVDVAGFQEGRSTQHEICDEVGPDFAYRKFCSASERGQYGSQVWISLRSRWKVESFAIVEHSPRIMCVAGVYGDIRCAICSAHAPHSQLPDETIDTWWTGFKSLLHNLRGSLAPIIFLDANARFSVQSDGTRRPCNRNAVHLVECCHAFGLVFTEHIDVEGRPVVTWVSPMKRPAKLDYILLAKEWAGAFRTLGCPQQSVDMFSEIDHWPLLADVTVQTGVKVDHRVRIDRQALMRDKDRLGQILREVEPSAC